MKFKALVPFLVIASLVATDLQARGFGHGGGGNGGGNNRAAGNRQTPRSPMTGSKMNRPVQQKPQARPAQRPVQRPAPQPAQRPQTRPAPGGQQRPETRPAPRPETRPGGQQRPETRPAPRPETLPAERPGTRPGNRPGGGQQGNRPGTKPMPLPSRPETKPGNIHYPKPGQRPGGGGNTIVRPGGGNTVVRPGGGNTIVRPGGGNTIINNRPVQINRPNISTRPVNRPGWGNNWGSWGNWNRPVNRPGGNVNIGNSVNVNINNNFHHNQNWGYKPNYWGSRPWWNNNYYHSSWHHGSWNYGWNKRWYGHYHYYRPRPWPGYVIYEDNRNDFAAGVAWGIAAWGLGNMIYNLGYQSYRNPYPAPPVQSGNTTVINYSEPITVSAGKMPPGDAAAEKSAEEKSSAALAASRSSFKQGDYLTALKKADEAIAAVPGDPAAHEYRGLVLFALGKYGEAAGVLNPVLASGPGWDWTTMTGLYASQSTYTEQLRKLEDYSRAKPDDAATRFLLGYHYLVCAHLDQAYEQFDQAAKLQPADTIAAQLRDLCKSSLSQDDEAEAEPAPEVEAPASPAIEAGQLIGTWVSDRGEAGKVTLKLADDGKFVWTFSKGAETNDLSGTFSIDERGLLVLASEDSQMVGEVKLPAETKLNFVLAGGPQGDPGLSFDRQP
jgi:tetratricopeptide (TPR) repeat protein